MRITLPERLRRLFGSACRRRTGKKAGLVKAVVERGQESTAKPLVLLACAEVLLGSGIGLASPATALSAAEARHLLVRSGTAATPAEIDALVPLSREAAVESILKDAADTAATPSPAWVEGWVPPQMKGLSSEERKLVRRLNRERGLELRAWWIQEMATTPTPITEVMTLFWHNHFTSSLQKVKAPVLLYRQNRLLRREALGNFARLLKAVARDPAMLIYLDGAKSRKDAPNENFARELFELFTLGEGHYRETDIKEAARAFTGWSVNRRTAGFSFRGQWHDDGDKTVLGSSGALDGDDVIETLLDQPQTATFIVEKLWRHFVSEEPDREEVRRLARLFRETGYEIKPLLAALFTSDAFWAPENRGRLIKSPVDYIVGTVRLFNLPVSDYRDLARLSRRLGQDLFNPPNVKGWPGGADWIVAASLLDRQAMAERITGGRQIPGAQAVGMDRPKKRQAERARHFDGWLASQSADWQWAEAITLLLLPVPPVDVEVLDRKASGALLRQLVLDPAYQLK